VNFYFALPWMVPVVVALLAGVLEPPLHPAIINNVINAPIATIIRFLMGDSFPAAFVRGC
jgi:hypothetical protein